MRARRSYAPWSFSPGVVCGLLSCAAAVAAEPRVQLAILVTHDTHTTVKLWDPSADAGSRTMPARTIGAPITHAPDAVVRGALVDAHTALIAAEEDRGPDRSFSGALWRVDERGASRLFDGVAYASRPLVIGRRAYVQTGRAGSYREPGVLRDDELALTELDLDTGATRALLRLRGQLTFPVGVHDGELVAYLVGPPGSAGDAGRLVAIGLATGTVRDLGAIGVARDLSLAARLEAAPALGPAVVYEGRRPSGRAIFARSLDGTELCLLQGGRLPLSPVVTPSGVVHSVALGASAQTENHAPLEVLRVAGDAGWLVAQRHVAGVALPRIVVRRRERELVVPAAPGERLEPIGFVAEPR